MGHHTLQKSIVICSCMTTSYSVVEIGGEIVKSCAYDLLSLNDRTPSRHPWRISKCVTHRLVGSQSVLAHASCRVQIEDVGSVVVRFEVSVWNNLPRNSSGSARRCSPKDALLRKNWRTFPLSRFIQQKRIHFVGFCLKTYNSSCATCKLRTTSNFVFSPQPVHGASLGRFAAGCTPLHEVTQSSLVFLVGLETKN